METQLFHVILIVLLLPNSDSYGLRPCGSGSFLWMKQHKSWLLPPPQATLIPSCSTYVKCTSTYLLLLECIWSTYHCQPLEVLSSQNTEMPPKRTHSAKGPLCCHPTHIWCAFYPRQKHTHITSTVTYCPQSGNRYCCVDSTVIYPASKSWIPESNASFYIQILPERNAFRETFSPLENSGCKLPLAN